MGTRSSTSLLERFSDRILSSPNMVGPAGVVWSRARMVEHGGNEMGTHGGCYYLLASPGKQVKASHRVRASRCAGRMFVDIHSSRERSGYGHATQPVKACWLSGVKEKSENYKCTRHTRIRHAAGVRGRSCRHVVQRPRMRNDIQGPHRSPRRWLETLLADHCGMRSSAEMAPARRCVPSDTSWGNVDRRET